MLVSTLPDDAELTGLHLSQCSHDLRSQLLEQLETITQSRKDDDADLEPLKALPNWRFWSAVIRAENPADSARTIRAPFW